ncbi:putative metal homeostasis protein [Liquorilactobacillus oeni]|nr:putative metal homeostasis protein [Liquorilactobacillus oeni]
MTTKKDMNINSAYRLLKSPNIKKRKRALKIIKETKKKARSF